MKTQLKLICQIFHFANKIQQNFTIRMELKRMKLPKLLMEWHELFLHVSIWVSEEGRNLKISAKNAVFLISSAKNQISLLVATRRKTFGKIH